MIKSIVVVGGGTAGWLTAGLIAARHVNDSSDVSVTLIESPEVGIIGVGEGTWPTMVNTLQQLGIPETEFLLCCDASFKQASKFNQWVTGDKHDSYYHPFTPPQGFEQVSLAEQAQRNGDLNFAHQVSIQAELCDKKKAPKQLGFADYATVENHGYHLDAGKFTQLLTRHCTGKLGVRHVQDFVTGVNGKPNGDIDSLSTKQHGEMAGDLFIDCTGQAGLLIDKHYKIPFICQKDVLFIDKALAVQVPYTHSDDDIESATLSTAQTAGWIWDIGLPTRRGVGHVFSTKYISCEQAKRQLIDYLKPTVSNPEQYPIREIDINPGYREVFWHKNCVAIGMASGFLEPLEASALVMIELAAKTISLQMPANREAMDVIAKQYNDNMRFRWQRIIDFLKLHYVLSKREDSDFWLDNRRPETIPDSLSEMLTLWRYQPPTNNGFLSPYDLFPAASYQYILYGMNFKTVASHLGNPEQNRQQAKAELDKVIQRKQKVVPLLPSNRELLTQLQKQHAQGAESHWPYVPYQQLTRVAQQFPILFKRKPDGTGLTFVAISGFTAEQRALNKSECFAAHACDSLQSTELFDYLSAHDLVEPVKLDITFDDHSSIVIDDLFVLNRDKLNAHSNFSSTTQTLLTSLNQMPRLIEQKNNLQRRTVA